MNVQLLYFPGCPNVDAARTAIRDALAAEKLDIQVEEIDVEDPAAPGWARGWGSPTILINGKDVAGQTRFDASACRIYASGVPSVAAIREHLAVRRGNHCTKRDLVMSRLAILIWCLPAALIVAGALWTPARPWLWIPSFTLMGAACVLNARHCGRLHCHVTGPVFLLAALATALDARGVANLPWTLIAGGALLGTLFGYALEWLRGKYVR